MVEYSFCMVNWNGGETFARSVRSILSEAEGLDAELIIVDNGSSDGSPDRLPEDSRIRLLRNDSNTYFASATNKSVRAARGRYLVLLNNDIIFPRGSLRYYLDAVKKSPDSVVCPRLVNDDGSPQASMRNILTPRIFFNAIARLSGRSGSRWILGDFDFNREQRVEQPLYSLLFMASSTFKKVGKMDTRFPLFFNDVDWFKRAKESGVRTVYMPGPGILHRHGYSTGKKPYKKVAMSTLSMARYFCKHYPFVSPLLLPSVAISGLIRFLIVSRRNA